MTNKIRNMRNVSPEFMHGRIVEMLNQVQLNLEERIGENAAHRAVSDAIDDYSKRMEARYPDTFDRVATLHALTGTGPWYGEDTPHRRTTNIVDFPRDDSALVFLRNLRQKFQI